MTETDDRTIELTLDTRRRPAGWGRPATFHDAFVPSAMIEATHGEAYLTSRTSAGTYWTTNGFIAVPAALVPRRFAGRTKFNSTTLRRPSTSWFDDPAWRPAKTCAYSTHRRRGSKTRIEAIWFRTASGCVRGFNRGYVEAVENLLSPARCRWFLMNYRGDNYTTMARVDTADDHPAAMVAGLSLSPPPRIADPETNR